MPPPSAGPPTHPSRSHGGSGLRGLPCGRRPEDRWAPPRQKGAHGHLRTQRVQRARRLMSLSWLVTAGPPVAPANQRLRRLMSLSWLVTAGSPVAPANQRPRRLMSLSGQVTAGSPAAPTHRRVRRPSYGGCGCRHTGRVPPQVLTTAATCAQALGPAGARAHAHGVSVGRASDRGYICVTSRPAP